MKRSSKDYGNESISSLKGADRVRKRPAVIFGSDGIDGCQHSIFEILSNSIDEAREGYGNLINITRFEDDSVEIEDFGRGMPLDYNQNEERYNWELIFCELYAGGKYKNIEGESYEYSLGLNGLGSCATQYSSEYMDVTVTRDGFRYSIHFEKGENKTGTPEGFIKEPVTSKKTGSKIRWKPDLDVFTDIHVPLEYYLDTLKRQAVVNSGLTFILKDQKGSSFDTYEFCYQNGISDYLSELSSDEPLTAPQLLKTERTGRDREDKPEYKVKMEITFLFDKSKSFLEYYHNSSWLEYGGSPDKAVRSAFISAIDAFLKQNNKYQKNESKINFQDVADSLIIITNSFSTYTSYENQTKKAITNKFIQEAMTEFLRSSLEIYFIENPTDASKIAEQVLINKRSREQAEKARLNIKKKLAGGTDITNRVQKFVDCRTKDIERRELYIVEGDSALGSCKLGRDAEFQAIIPVRGKILNCLKAEYGKIFKNEIITDLIKVLGCGVETKSHSKDLSSFDLSALRWNKIIICTDADVDGFQIRTLILTMLYRLVPSLINERYVYIAESPLFEITCKGKSYFAYTDRDKDELIAKLEGKYSVLRSKGLGENEPEMMWQTTMNPETRRLIQVLPEQAEETSAMFDLLLGENLQGRKDYIAENGWRYLELTDLS
ncbi:MAG: toprim domain-containing protein [Clostridiales bacterium]|nr:toprim domain-containing protein [Clostridiales bacterium]